MTEAVRRRVILVGAPGAGKTTVARALAERLGGRHVDIDAQIEAATGKRVAEIFTEQGEAAFRSLEVAHTLAALSGPAAVISLGGGAVMNSEIRAALQPEITIWLRVSAATAAQRVGLTASRPLLLGNVRATLISLLQQRTPIYAELADLTVDTDDATLTQIVEQIQTWLENDPRWQVAAPFQTVSAGSYPIRIGRGLLPGIADLVGRAAPQAAQVALVHTDSVAATARQVAENLQRAGLSPLLLEVPRGEAAKDGVNLMRCWDLLAAHNFNRSDLIIGIGGGAVTDLAGFVAASWLRGVPLITIPTTLLAMVDAAVGGKTGINLGAGKNLVGAFWEPAGVICDLDLLATLPPAEFRAGLAEVVKGGFIADPVILKLLSSQPDLAWNSPELAELVARKVRVKVQIATADLRESTRPAQQVGRELLNYGHTLAHAIEQRENFTWRHGDAVSVGLVFAAELARAAGRLSEAIADRHREILARLGLPTSYAAAPLSELVSIMAVDKKTRSGKLRFVILTDLAQAEILTDPAPELLQTAYHAISSPAH